MLQKQALATETQKLTDTSNKAAEINTTVDQEILSAVEHETRINIHETKEQTVVDKERHQDHCHTTIQPLKDREVLPEKHDHTQAATQCREIDRDTGDAKAQADEQRSGVAGGETIKTGNMVKDSGRDGGGGSSDGTEVGARKQWLQYYGSSVAVKAIVSLLPRMKLASCDVMHLDAKT